MKIVVCVKVIKGEINPFDASAIECALQLSDDVTVVSMGPSSTETVLLPLTRLGVRVILITDSLFVGSDTLATAYILSKAIQTLHPDLILCGRQSVDGDTAQVGPMLSAMLGISLITNALQVEKNENGITAKTRLGTESTTFPALVTVERSYTLRFPSIFSKLGEVCLLTNKELNCDIKRCGLAGSPTRVLETFENEKGKRRCRFISMDALKPLLTILQQQKVIKKNVHTKQKMLPCAWAIGKEVFEKACEIAENVVLIEKTDVYSIVKKVQEEKPGVVLWNGDLWGRRNAPIAAALLQTGLCADCTQLAAEEDTLIMYRPARGGNVYAKIKCLTKPQMATVRTKTASSDIIVSGGRGIADRIDTLYAFANEIGAELAASRGLVDTGKMPYDLQVGLTGKSVSPKIYIAIGISGAVHHTCAIENADTVIAINPDKNARIFEYADYGIVDAF
ncbi:MAG: FAD-binding protein [Clostridia bacterium]|nr:FAD-binding protein [Clostridia bacterium]